jgi:integrase
MPRKKAPFPSLQRHKKSGRGVVRLSGEDIYLGPWPAGQESPPPAVSAAYDLAISEWVARGRSPRPSPTSSPCGDVALSASITVAELIARYWAYAEGYYRDADGVPTGEVPYLRAALRPLNHLYGPTAAADFGPLRLKAVRELLVNGYRHPRYGEQGALSRNGVNGRCHRIVRVFKWAVAEELVPADALHALRAVPGLREGRTKARETEPVLPVAWEDVKATLLHLRPMTAAMVRVAWHTGMRPGEVCRLKLAELDRSGEVWLYRPAKHKTAHRGKVRVVAVGPLAQAVILQFVRVRCPLCGVEGRPPRIGSRDGATCGRCADELDAGGVCGPHPREEVTPEDVPLFSPARDRDERSEDERAARRTRVQPSQRNRRLVAPRRKPRDAYTPMTLGRAVVRAAKSAGVAPWHLNQIRHAHGTRVRAEFGLEAAQAALGHSRADVTQIYAERDLGSAVKVAREIG